MNQEAIGDDSALWARLAACFGLAAVISFVVATQIPISSSVNMGLFFLFGPALMAAMWSTFRFLQHDSPGPLLELATLFAVLAGLAHLSMATMQGAIHSRLRVLDPLLEERRAEVIRLIDSTQLGLDMAFDILISLGTLLLGVVLFAHPRFGKGFGIPAIAVAVAGISFNAIGFPDNPGQVGLLDPGPLFGAFYLAFSIQLFRCSRHRA